MVTLVLSGHRPAELTHMSMLCTLCWLISSHDYLVSEYSLQLLIHLITNNKHMKHNV